MAIRDSEVSAIKTGMIREFVIRANESINELADLSDKSVDMIKCDYEKDATYNKLNGK